MRWAWTLLRVGLYSAIAGCERCSAKGRERPTGRRDVVKTADSVSTKSPADWTANEIRKRLLATYRQAKTYRDQAVVRLAFRQNGQRDPAGAAECGGF